MIGPVYPVGAYVGRIRAERNALDRVGELNRVGQVEAISSQMDASKRSEAPDGVRGRVSHLPPATDLYSSLQARLTHFEDRLDPAGVHKKRARGLPSRQDFGVVLDGQVFPDDPNLSHWEAHLAAGVRPDSLGSNEVMGALRMLRALARREPEAANELLAANPAFTELLSEAVREQKHLKQSTQVDDGLSPAFGQAVIQ